MRGSCVVQAEWKCQKVGTWSVERNVFFFKSKILSCLDQYLKVHVFTARDVAEWTRNQYVTFDDRLCRARNRRHTPGGRGKQFQRFGDATDNESIRHDRRTGHGRSRQGGCGERDSKICAPIIEFQIRPRQFPRQSIGGGARHGSGAC